MKALSRALFALLAAGSVLSMFLRATTGLLGPRLVEELGVSPSGLGLVTGVFLIAIGMGAIPVGVALDRFGPRLVMCSSLVLAAFGSLIFSVAGSTAALILGRALMGAGCAPLYVGALFIFAATVPKDRFVSMTGRLGGIASIGFILSTVPLEYCFAALGWRWTFRAVALVALLLAALCYRTIESHQRGRAVQSSLGEEIRQLGVILRQRSLWNLLVVGAITTPPAAMIVSLWGAPYLTDVCGAGVQERANILLPVSLVAAFGYLLSAAGSRRLGNRTVVLGGLCSSMVVYGSLALLHPNLGWTAALFLLVAATGGLSAPLFAHGRSLLPPESMGRGLALLNLCFITGSGLVQAMTGVIAGAFDRGGGPLPVEAYQSIFGAQALLSTAAVLLFRRAASR